MVVVEGEIWFGGRGLGWLGKQRGGLDVRVRMVVEIEGEPGVGEVKVCHAVRQCY